jgi:hypothetical protein
MPHYSNKLKAAGILLNTKNKPLYVALSEALTLRTSPCLITEIH